MNVFLLALLLVSVSCQMEDKNGIPMNTEKPTNYKWTECYDELGCLNNTDEWFHPRLRPINDKPLPRHIIKTTFYLFHKGKDAKHLVNVDPIEPVSQDIRHTAFNRRLRTHILIHDFTSNGLAGWIKHAVKSLLAGDTGNVISADWTGGAEPPYHIAVQNARVVGLEISYLLKILIKDLGMSIDQFHLIGQGVGAHIAGYVGQNIEGVVNRITGLDPVGMYFSDMPCVTRLDPEDAGFVDIIYTDIAKNHGQGGGDPYGHLNFYPNGGLTQGGCNATSLYPPLNEITRDMLREGQVAPGCSHKRAAKYFTASIDEAKECTMMAYLCADYAGFERGECLECQLGYTCAPMGYGASSVRANLTTPPGSKMFVDTNSDHPYCMFAYKVTVTLVPGDIGSPDVGGEGGAEGMFCATVYSETEDIMFRTNLNMGAAQKSLNTNGDNVFLTYQKAPKVNMVSKVILRFDSEQNSTVVYVTRVRITLQPEWGKLGIPLCGRHQITKFVTHTQAEFTPCSKATCKSTVEHSKFFRLRRNPEEDPPPDPQSPSDSDYDEDELPPPPEDDYYSNR